MCQYIRLLCIFCLCVFFQNSHAQNNRVSEINVNRDSLRAIPDSLKVKKPKKPFKFTIDGVRAGFDIVYPIFDNIVFPNNPFNPNDPLSKTYRAKQRYEASIDVGFAQNRFFAVLDYGYSLIERYRLGLPYTGFTYKNTGSYLRVGVDYNFMHNYFKEEAMFVGFRYARAGFRHDFQYFGASEAWNFRPPRVVVRPDTAIIVDERFVGNISESGLSASWVELVLGLKVNVWKQFFMGYTARIMIRSGIKGEDKLLANELPGFGSTNKTARVFFNYYLAYRLTFKHKYK